MTTGQHNCVFGRCVANYALFLGLIRNVCRVIIDTEYIIKLEYCLVQLQTETRRQVKHIQGSTYASLQILRSLGPLEIGLGWLVSNREA